MKNFANKIQEDIFAGKNQMMRIKTHPRRFWRQESVIKGATLVFKKKVQLFTEMLNMNGTMWS